MSKIYIANAFSLSMFPRGHWEPLCDAISAEAAASAAQEAHKDGVLVSCVGHADTARIFESVLGVPVPANRQSITVEIGDLVLVGQYRGPRLPEGATSLPEGATIEWWLVRCVKRAPCDGLCP